MGSKLKNDKPQAPINRIIEGCLKSIIFWLYIIIFDYLFSFGSSCYSSIQEQFIGYQLVASLASLSYNFSFSS